MSDVCQAVPDVDHMDVVRNADSAITFMRCGNENDVCIIEDTLLINGRCVVKLGVTAQHRLAFQQQQLLKSIAQ